MAGSSSNQRGRPDPRKAPSGSPRLAGVLSGEPVGPTDVGRSGSNNRWAQALGHDDIVRFLNTNLNEEKAADTKLSTVALRKGVNRKAAS